MPEVAPPAESIFPLKDMNERRFRFFARPSIALGVLFVVALFSYIDRSLISILQVEIKTELRLNDTQLGALTGLSFALFYATAAIPIARLIDKGKRTFLMALALLVWTLMTAASGFANSFATLAAMRVGVAIGEAGSLPATHSLLSDHFPLERRGRAFAVWALASPLGVMLGLFFGGWVGSALGWRSSFLFIGLAGLAMVPLVALLKEPRRGQHDATPMAAPAQSLRQALGLLSGMRPFRTLVVGATLYSFSYMALVNWLPPFLARAHALPIGDVATTAAIIIGGGGGLGALAGGMAVDALIKRDFRWYAWGPATTALLMIPASLGFLFIDSLWPAAICGFLAVLCATFLIAPTNSLAQSMVTSELRGLTSAVLLVIPTIFGLGLGPLLTGAVSDAIHLATGDATQGIRYALAMSLVGSAIGGVFYLRLARQLKVSSLPVKRGG